MERAPPQLRDPDVVRLRLQLIEEIGPVRWRGDAGLTGSGWGFDGPGCPARDVHEHHRQVVAAECRR
ncbi:MAG TPA: hypothetical protein VGA04_05365 [Streptosporangiaceae bacterium]